MQLLSCLSNQAVGLSYCLICPTSSVNIHPHRKVVTRDSHRVKKSIDFQKKEVVTFTYSTVQAQRGLFSSVSIPEIITAVTPESRRRIGTEKDPIMLSFLFLLLGFQAALTLLHPSSSHDQEEEMRFRIFGLNHRPLNPPPTGTPDLPPLSSLLLFPFTLSPRDFSSLLSSFFSSPPLLLLPSSSPLPFCSC